MKQCAKCKKLFPATKEYFNSDRQKADGLCPYCKTCRHIQKKLAYRNSPKTARENSLIWYYANQERARKKRKEQYWRNREKAISDAREWRVQNPEKYKETNRTYYKRIYPTIKDRIATHTRNRRARIAGLPGRHTQKDIEYLLIQQSGRCFYCGDPLYTYQVDHFIPVSKGGPNSPDNLVLACEHCNKSKGSRLPEDWHPIS